MNISVCITTLNEEGSIAPLLSSLLIQSLKPQEIIIVDGGSSDRTVDIIRHFQKKDGRIKLLVEKCLRARGRNLSVEIAKGEIVAVTDAGCIPRAKWLEEITAPFESYGIDVSAGFYKMKGETPLERAMAPFLGVAPGQFNVEFLPSTRSIAFKKKTWEEVGGFPEDNNNLAEDTYFNYKLLKAGVKIARVKSALVEWGMPENINEFFLKLQNYAKWDAASGIWLFPKKGLMSHNIKVLFVFLRYLIGLCLLSLSLKSTIWLVVLAILIFAYVFRSFKKAGLWGIPLQFVSDFAVMSGFLKGILNK